MKALFSDANSGVDLCELRSDSYATRESKSKQEFDMRSMSIPKNTIQ